MRVTRRPSEWEEERQEEAEPTNSGADPQSMRRLFMAVRQRGWTCPQLHGNAVFFFEQFDVISSHRRDTEIQKGT